MTNTDDHLTPADMGELLRHTRIARGLTVREAALLLGQRPDHLELIEKGGRWRSVSSWMSAFQTLGGRVTVKGNPPTLRLTPRG